MPFLIKIIMRCSEELCQKKTDDLYLVDDKYYCKNCYEDMIRRSMRDSIPKPSSSQRRNGNTIFYESIKYYGRKEKGK